MTIAKSVEDKIAEHAETAGLNLAALIISADVERGALPDEVTDEITDEITDEVQHYVGQALTAIAELARRGLHRVAAPTEYGRFEFSFTEADPGDGRRFQADSHAREDQP